ncbi:Alpha/Beta hydrolase protein [Podospora didyma]|uniref:Alpha/Beta hydrolase protein n=1 Tax=Podospora didyma TaxID=330526 RepID=A0AAE0NX60_9PEZI|nr:Alpha/Beta hydrolase protein [Podospora didyma]
MLFAFLRGLALRNYAMCGFCRLLLGWFTPRQTQAIMPSSIEIYTSWITKQRLLAPPSSLLHDLLQVDIEPLPSCPTDASILWLGDRHTAKKFILFLHGGGFTLNVLSGHLGWCLSAWVHPDLNYRYREDVAVAILDYSLAPSAKYPTQLIEASHALRHVLQTVCPNPSDLIIGGDSAGGCLTAQLLCHLVHPHPHKQAVLPPDTIDLLRNPLAGAFLVSPWLSTSTTSDSFARNSGIDMLSPSMMKKLARDSLEGTSWHSELANQQGGWAMPLEYPDSSNLVGIERIVRRLYVTVGEHEVLRDQGVEFVQRMRAVVALGSGGGGEKSLKKNPEEVVKLDILPEAAHDFILVEGGFGEVGPAMKRMRDWTKTAFAGW